MWWNNWDGHGPWAHNWWMSNNGMWRRHHGDMWRHHGHGWWW